MTFGENIFKFYCTLQGPRTELPTIDIMLPFESEIVKEINSKFYQKYYNNNRKRFFLIGINPGRFGAGITGIPFTDPVNLENILRIKNPFPKKHELSSQFIFQVIDGIGGPKKFFDNFYLTAVSPLGFIKNNKNINYYDIKSIKDTWESYFIEWMTQQLKAGGNTKIAFILGQGENSKYFQGLNEKSQLFNRLIPLPHPRWVMQYHFKNRAEFIKKYVRNLQLFL